MEFYFLGTGNAFGHGGRRRSHYLWKGEENWLIDASYDSLAGLRSIGMTSKDVDKIFISHLHPDHFMGLPQFSLEDFYVLKKENPIEVYGPIGMEKLIKEATSLFFNDEVVEHLDSLYNFHEVPENESLDFVNGNLQTLPADHTGNARMQIISMNDISLGYTGDTAFIPDVFDQLLDADFTITEASSGDHFIPHHITLQQLLDHNIPEEKSVYVSHVGESTLNMKDQIQKPLILTHDGMKISLN